MSRRATFWMFGIASTAFALTGAAATPQEGVSPSSQPNTLQIIQAIRTQGLHGAALLTGNYVGPELIDSEGVAPDLEEIARESSLVIIGVPVGSMSRLSDDGMQIYTDYQVNVERTFKGQFLPGATVSVSVLGGKVWFDDGTSAESRVLGFRPLENDGRYLLFLCRPQVLNKTSQKSIPYPGLTLPAALTYSLTFGRQGAFQLPAKVPGQSVTANEVKPQSTRDIDDVAVKYAHSDEASFLQDVQAAVQRFPK